ncbi:MAG: glutathione synthase [Burkholderiales bacterium]|nr:glutathione synthase [Burkholderiales bacterium]
MKKVLFIADPLSGIKITGDSTYLMLITAYDLGYELYVAESKDLFAIGNHAYVNVEKLQLSHGVKDIHSTQNWYTVTDKFSKYSLTNFDAVYVRNDPPFNMEYYYLTQILDLAVNLGVNVVNNPTLLRNCNEKLTILNFPHLITPTLVAKDKATILEFIKEQGVCVAKPIDLMGGRGIFRIAADDPNQNAILESLTDYYTQTIMVQKFIPEVVNGDKRIFIIDGEVVEYCLARIPQNGEIRGNLAVGGRGEVQKLTDSDKTIANEVAKWLKNKGIMIAGLDVIGTCLTEVNITSPTSMQQIYRESGINVARLILEKI